MIRKSTINLNNSNKNKIDKLDILFFEAKIVINKFIDEIWEQEDFSSKFISFKVDTWLSSRMQQNLGKQALEIVKSQRKRKRKTKPVFDRNTIELDSRFIDIQFDSSKEFDIFIKFKSIGNKIIFHCPSKKHKHINKYFSNNWLLKKSAKLRKDIFGNYLLDLYFEKQEIPKRVEGKDLGIDLGYKKLLVDNEGNIYGRELEQQYYKISRKIQGSKKFKKSLVERNNKVNEVINKIDFSKTKNLFIEDLKEVKKSSKGRIYKKFMNKLQRWSYPLVINKLLRLCEEQGINLVKVSPAYTSQQCSNCKTICKSHRQGEIYKCKVCGLLIDSDMNASINILHRGIYSFSIA